MTIKKSIDTTLRHVTELRDRISVMEKLYRKGAVPTYQDIDQLNFNLGIICGEMEMLENLIYREG